MKKMLLLVVVAVLCISCPGTVPEVEPGEETPPEVLPLKFVAIGDDFTMGVQSAGLREDFQLNSYPYLVSAQAAAAGLSNVFEQPDVSSPGIGSLYVEPLGLYLDNQITTTVPLGTLSEEDLFSILLERLANKSLRRPYNNLGVNGATLAELSSVASAADTDSGDNFFYDIVLRNLAVPGIPNFGGKTALEQVALLDTEAPTDTTVFMVWIGINDIVGAAITGGTIITPAAFETEYEAMLTALTVISDNIVVANLPTYVPFFYALDNVFSGPTAMMFEIFGMFSVGPDTDLEPVDLDAGGGGLFVPLELEESDATHLLLTAALEYWLNGLGIPTADYLENTMSVDPAIVSGIIAGRADVGSPIPADMTLTDAEITEIVDAITACNTIISDLATEYGCGLVDINAIMADKATMNAAADYSGEYYLTAPDDTFFSLDALHPSDLGYAVIANAFIEAINGLAVLDADLDLLGLASFAGQYSIID